MRLEVVVVPVADGDRAKQDGQAARS